LKLKTLTETATVVVAAAVVVVDVAPVRVLAYKISLNSQESFLAK
jgi:hypothetical protein